MTTSKFLYCTPGAERAHTDPVACYEAECDGYANPDDRHPREIEQWTARSAAEFMPDPIDIAEHAAESFDEMLNAFEEAAEQLDAAVHQPDVTAAFRVALDLMASKVTWLTCGELVATHLVTWDDAGEPLLDGQPLYGTREGSAA